MNLLNFDSPSRLSAWAYLVQKLENYYNHTKEWPVNPILDIEKVTAHVQNVSLENGIGINEAIDHVMAGFRDFHVHTPHPLYLGLFNPRANYPSIIGDSIAAAVNPQMAAWSHAPFANEVEKYIIGELGRKFGFRKDVDGVFTGGGTEANLTALCAAIRYYFPAVKDEGLRSLDRQPVLYTSRESHHSVLKSAVVTGLGKHAVRSIEVNQDMSMNIHQLESRIQEDLSLGHRPFLVVATAGTTGAGGFDHLTGIRLLCEKYDLWMHVDAAYGGACALSDKYRYLLDGISQADSVTFDAHKWLSVPMGGGIYFTSHPDILQDTFQMVAHYMPKEAEEMAVIDSYNHSIQWSRRFIGLKLYMSLMVIGWKGYEESICEDFRIGRLLVQRLETSGWKVYNNTELPIVCFNKPEKIDDEVWTRNFVNKLVSSRKIWVSTYPVHGQLTIRACITNFLTRDKEVDEIAELINSAFDQG